MDLPQAVEIAKRYIIYLDKRNKLKDIKSLKLYQAKILTSNNEKTDLFYIEKTYNDNNKRILTLNKGYADGRKGNQYVNYLQQNNKILQNKLLREWRI